MGLQSSRIIWGRDRMPGANEPQPVGIYDSMGTLYIAGNYAIVASSAGKVATDYHLFLCTATETGGDFISTDWKEQIGVKNWYLMSRRKFKKGARVIKEDTNGDFDSMKLYKCISDMKMPNVWNPDEWAVVYQDVGVTYQMRDHKEVYYDSGGNAVKWHKKMYYMPPIVTYAPDFSEEEEYVKGDQATYNGHVYTYKKDGPYMGPWIAADWALTDNKVLSDVTMFDNEWQYHKDDKAIYEHPVNGVKLYKFKDVTPYRGEWSAGRWDEIPDVSEYEANVAYSKGDICLKRNVDIIEIGIMEYQTNYKYSAGKYCLYPIDRDIFGDVFSTTTVYERGDICMYKGHRYIFNQEGPYFGPFIPLYFTLSDLFPVEYQERIASGETIFGLFKSNQIVTDQSWTQEHWDLMTNEAIQIKGRTYNNSNHYIMQFIIGHDYSADELCIWTMDKDDEVMGLLVSKRAIPNCSPAQAPPNEDNWQALYENLDGIDQYYAFKALRDISAADNPSWQPQNWAVLDQKIDPDDGLYGIIWEKYGVIGGGGSPFGYAFPTYGGSMYYSGDLTERRGRFAYFLTTSTNAKFNAYQTYIMRTDYGNVPGITGWAITYTLDNSTGFHKMITKNGVAYGIPSWDSQLAANYIYFKLFDDWQKVDLPCYIVINELDTFNFKEQKNIGYLSITAVNGGFISLKLVDLYTRQGMEHSFRTKLSHFIIGLDGSYLSDNIIEINDAELQDELHYHTFSQRICFYNSDIIYARDLVYTDDAYAVTDGYWVTHIKLQKSYLINENGEAAIASDAVNGYVNHIFNKFMHFSSYDYSRNEVEDIVSVGVKVNYNLVYKENLEWVTPDREPTLSEFYNIANTMGLNVVIVNDRYALENCPVGVDCYPIQNVHDNFENISNSGHYELVFFSYGFYTDSDDYYKIRVRIRFRSLSSLGINDTVVFEEIYNTELSRSQIQNALYNDELIDYSENLPIKFDSIGRVGSKYYFLITEPGTLGYYSTYVSESFIRFTNSANFCEIWAVDLAGKTLEKVTTNGFRYIILRYINNGYVNIDGHHVTHLKLLFSTYENYDRKHIDYELRENEENSYNLIKYIRIDDRNLFSNSAGSSVSTFTGGIFLTEHFQSNIGATFGIFIYLPIFNMASKTIMESTGFFWLSSGNETALGSGDFYGGYQYDSTNFDLPLVF